MHFPLIAFLHHIALKYYKFVYGEFNSAYSAMLSTRGTFDFWRTPRLSKSEKEFIDDKLNPLLKGLTDHDGISSIEDIFRLIESSGSDVTSDSLYPGIKDNFITAQERDIFSIGEIESNQASGSNRGGNHPGRDATLGTQDSKDYYRGLVDKLGWGNSWFSNDLENAGLI